MLLKNISKCCRNIDTYEKIRIISSGNFGNVYKSRNTRNNKIFAIKRLNTSMCFDTNGFSLLYLREISILKSISHENIIKLEEIVEGKNITDLFIVMEYCDIDLKAFLNNSRINELATRDMISRENETNVEMNNYSHAWLTNPNAHSCKTAYGKTTSHPSIGTTNSSRPVYDCIKSITYQLFRAIEFLHDNSILHRDLKPSNILLKKDGTLKLADFGLARVIDNKMSNLVVTLWYRAPEILLGSSDYDYSVDLWSIGCVVAEMLIRKPILPGEGELDQLNKIFHCFGLPNKEDFDGYELPNLVYIDFNTTYESSLNSQIDKYDEEYVEIIRRLLVYSPRKRLSAKEALKLELFSKNMKEANAALAAFVLAITKND